MLKKTDSKTQEIEKEAEIIIDNDEPNAITLSDNEELLLDQDYEDDPDFENIDKALVAQTATAPTILQQYLNELRKYPLMTREEERSAAIKAFEENDLQSRQKLVTANLRLVVKIAMDYRTTSIPLLDLIQEGNAGLVQAVNRFNPYRDVKLSTYSAWWIRAFILKFLMDNKSLVRMGTTEAQRRLFFKLRSEAQKLYARTQTFDPKLLAERIGVEQQDVIDMEQRLTKSDVSLDVPVGDQNNGTTVRRMDLLLDEKNDVPDNIYEHKELLNILRAKLTEIAHKLNERDLYILSNRILSDTPITLQEIGDKYGITRERARQLERQVLKKICEKLKLSF